MQTRSGIVVSRQYILCMSTANRYVRLQYRRTDSIRSIFRPTLHDDGGSPLVTMPYRRHVAYLSLISIFPGVSSRLSGQNVRSAEVYRVNRADQKKKKYICITRLEFLSCIQRSISTDRRVIVGLGTFGASDSARKIRRRSFGDRNFRGREFSAPRPSVALQPLESQHQDCCDELTSVILKTFIE